VANGGHLLDVGVAQGEVGLDRLGALDEEADGRRLGYMLQHGLFLRRRQRQRRDRVCVFYRQAQPFSACHQDREGRDGRRQVGDHEGGLHDLLEVVKHQQHAARRQGRLQLVDQRPPTGRAHSQLLGDSGDDERRIPHRGKGHEDDPVRELRGQFGGDLHGEAGLAHPAWAGQRHQPDIPAPQEGNNRVHVALAPDQRRGRHRQRRGQGPELMEEGNHGRWWITMRVGCGCDGHGLTLIPSILRMAWLPASGGVN
jgi:hypothetical protein